MNCIYESRREADEGEARSLPQCCAMGPLGFEPRTFSV